MKKGFTLVELIAVITVLGVIGLIAVPTVNNVINSSKEKAKEVQIKQIIEIARGWAANNAKELSEEEDYYLDVETLLEEGYIDTEEIIDPTTKTNLDGCILISYSDKYNNYQFKYTDCN